MINLITGYMGEPHVSSSQFRDMVMGMVGTDDYVSQFGDRLKITKVNNTSFTVGSGTAYHNGCVFNIPYGSVENVSIDTESVGYSRRDRIVIRWTINSSTGIESASIVVVKGTATNGTATNPAVNTGNMQTGASISDFIVGTVAIDSSGVATVEQGYFKIPGLDVFHPVGSYIYTSKANNPATYLGGTWEQIQGRFLLGASGSYSLGSTGGEASHTLTVNELPAHNHRFTYTPPIWDSKTGPSGSTIDVGGVGSATTSTTANTGSGAAHNNMPPYLATYIWHRTA